MCNRWEKTNRTTLIELWTRAPVHRTVDHQWFCMFRSDKCILRWLWLTMSYQLVSRRELVRAPTACSRVLAGPVAPPAGVDCTLHSASSWRGGSTRLLRSAAWLEHYLKGRGECYLLQQVFSKRPPNAHLQIVKSSQEKACPVKWKCRPILISEYLQD